MNHRDLEAAQIPNDRIGLMNNGVVMRPDTT